jgi:hypothetical protein
MASYRLVTYATAAEPRAGVVIGDEVFDAGALTGHAGDATVLGILDDWRRRAPPTAKPPPRRGRARGLPARGCSRRSGGRRRSIAPGRTMPTTPPRWPG